jgi:hypothetical protein
MTATSTSADTLPELTLADLHTPPRRAAQRLRNTLRLNATTSLLGGVVAVAMPGPLDGVLGTGHSGWVRLVGAGLVVFAAELFLLAGARLGRLLRWTPAVIAADLAWVAGTATTIGIRWYRDEGVVVITAVAVMVGVFAVAQFAGWRGARVLRSSAVSDLDQAPPVEIARIERVVHGDIDAAWQVITDYGRCARLAPNVESMHTATANGASLQRTCTDRRGEPREQSRTLWDENTHLFDVAVATAATDYPYLLQTLSGSWWATAGPPHQVRLGMDVAFRPRRGMRGRVVATAAPAAFALSCRRIVRGWASAIADQMSSQASSRVTRGSSGAGR